MDRDRRSALRHLLLGPGLVGLRAMATGIPASLLLAADRGLPDLFFRQAKAAEAAQASGRAPQYTLFASSGNGDPCNANVPGTYDDNTALHANHPAMAKTAFKLGDNNVVGAQCWSSLPDAMRNQLCFFHHSTYTVVHPDQEKVLRVQGQTTAGEMLPSLISKQLAPKLGTLRQQPISFNGVAGNITVDGVLQPTVSPGQLATMLSVPQQGLQDANLVALRDNSLDQLNAWIKQQGTSYQGSVIDQYALSQRQVRQMQEGVVGALQQIKGGGPADQIAAALVLFKLNVTPMAIIGLDFGGDNHFDGGLANEVRAHVESIGLMGGIPTSAAAAGLEGKVTFAMLNVFGRTLTSLDGRDHNDKHAVSFLAGANVRAGVVGGITPPLDNYRHVARAIDSTTGVASASGDVLYEDTFTAYGKTLAAACGMEDKAIDDAFRAGVGRVVRGAIAS